MVRRVNQKVEGGDCPVEEADPNRVRDEALLAKTEEKEAHYSRTT